MLVDIGRLAELSTCVLKAEPGKLDIKRREPVFFFCLSVNLLFIDKNPLMIKSMIFPTWDPNTSLSFLTSIVRMSTQMKMKEAMYSMNKTYQDHNLKIGVKKN